LVSLERLALPTFPPTDRPVRINVCRLARWRDGEIAQLEVFVDFGGAARQLGLA
jgi:ketosteroid isomerase-like protein